MRASQAVALMRQELADPKTSESQRVRLRRALAVYARETSPERQAQQARMGMKDNSGPSVTLQDGNMSFSTLGGEGKHS